MAVVEPRVCATPGCKTKLRASQSGLICDPCRVTLQEERAREVAREAGVQCRIEDCEETATKGVGSTSHRWRNLCDKHYLIELEKAREAAQTVERERREGTRPAKHRAPFLGQNGTSSTTSAGHVAEARLPPGPERVEIAGVRTALSESLVRVAKQLDVIDAQIKLLRDSAEPLMTEWDRLVAEVYELPELGSGPLDIAQGVSDGAAHD